MSRYTILCRLRWPAFLLLTGVMALLNEFDILSWSHSWPLYLILWGVLELASRATLAAEPQIPPAGYPNAAAYAAGYPPAGYAAQPGAYPPPYPPPYSAQYPQGATAPAPPVSSTGIVPANQVVDLTKEPRKSWEEEGR